MADKAVRISCDSVASFVHSFVRSFACTYFEYLLSIIFQANTFIIIILLLSNKTWSELVNRLLCKINTVFYILIIKSMAECGLICYLYICIFAVCNDFDLITWSSTPLSIQFYWQLAFIRPYLLSWLLAFLKHNSHDFDMENIEPSQFVIWLSWILVQLWYGVFLAVFCFFAFLWAFSEIIK